MKKFYNEHRVFIILMGIVFICFIIIIFLLLKYFYFGTTGKVPKRTCKNISATKQREVMSSIEVETMVNKAEIRVSDKSNIIFISILYNSEATLVEAQNKATESLDKFSDEQKACYDFDFIITGTQSENSEGFHLMGAKNKSGTNIYWNNNREIEVEDTE